MQGRFPGRELTGAKPALIYFYARKPRMEANAHENVSS